MKAVFFQAVFGVNPGYAHDNGLPENTSADQIVARAWREALEEEFSSSGILVGATIAAGRVTYPTDFGCPKDGEIIAVVSGNSNPKFVPEDAIPAFKEAVIRVCRAVKEKLAQSRVQLTFTEVHDFVYFEPEDSGGEQRWQ